MEPQENLEWVAPQGLPIEDSPQLDQAILEANVETLLMVYVHLTHDESMLDEFEPHIRIPYSIPATNIPEYLLELLRGKLKRVLTTIEGVASSEASDGLIRRMLGVGVGEPVDEEFIPLLYEQTGLRKPVERKSVAGRKAPPKDFKVLVIGAGMTGIVAGIKLGEAGYDYVTIEKNPDVGGTWYENTYPGVGVDTPSHFYSYSFELWSDWNNYNPMGGDMYKYLASVADKHKLRDNIRFNTRVKSLTYNEADCTWSVVVEAAEGETETIIANAVINGHGPINRWKYPDIEGLHDFEGPMMHTANWDHSVDLAGKRVAVIGTGASSAQLVPGIAAEVGDLRIFMRTKHWVNRNPEIGKEVSDGIKFCLANIPFYAQWWRFRVYWTCSDGLFANVVRDPDWDGNMLATSARNDNSRKIALNHMQEKLAGKPELIKKLTPDFPIYSKRIINDNGWYDALMRDNVYVEDTPIKRILATGIEMKDGSVYECDVIVCATGFNVSQMIGGLTIKGSAGRDLGEEWGEENPRSYFGITVPGYPNYFMTVGPNSAPNHAAGQNLVSEAQINYIIEALDTVVDNDAKAFETTEKAYLDWNEKVDARMQKMIWTHPGANSYYNNSQGRVIMSWPWRLVDYWTQSRKPEDGSYTLLK